MHRFAETLVKNNCAVLLVGIRFAHSQEIPEKAYSTYRMRMIFRKSFLFYAEYNIRLFFFLLQQRFNTLIACDLDTVLAAFAVAKIKNKELIFDGHEAFTEVPELLNRKFVTSIWRFIEKLILPRIEKRITVSNQINLYYQEKLGISFHVIRNLPFEYDAEKLFQATEILDCLKVIKHKIILYQGALNMGRGLESMIEAMQYIENAKFVIVGDGYLKEKLQKLVIIYQLEHKVVFTGKIELEKLKNITIRADLGISIEENCCLNYYFALPNKLFDYIQAHLPVLVSPLPEMKSIVEQYNIGLVLDNHTPEHIASKVNFMLNTRCANTLWKTNLETAAKELCWKNEEFKLLQLM